MIQRLCLILLFLSQQGFGIGAVNSCVTTLQVPANTNTRENFYGQLRERIFGYLSRRFNAIDPNQIEDATEEALVHILTADNAGALPREAGYFDAWTYRIAFNCLIDTFRAQRRQGIVQPLEHAPEPIERLRGHHESVVEFISQIRGAIVGFPAIERRIIELDLLGLENRLIAVLVMQHEGRVIHIRKVALQKLRRILMNDSFESSTPPHDTRNPLPTDEQINNAVASLPPRLHRIMQMRIEGQTVEAIADTLRESRQSVRQALTTAMTMLREQLATIMGTRAIAN